MKKMLLLVTIFVFHMTIASGHAEYTFQCENEFTVDLYTSTISEANLFSADNEENDSEIVEQVKASYEQVLTNPEVVIITVNNKLIPTIRVNLEDINIRCTSDEDFELWSNRIYNISYQALEYFFLSGSYYIHEESGLIKNIFLYLDTSYTGGGTASIIQQNLDSVIDSYNRKCAQILATTIWPNMSDEEMLLALHDYIASSVSYDYTYQEAAFTSYGAIMNGSAVCQGYSFAYKHLLKMIGINGFIVTSDEMGHAWNCVKLGENYYHIDITSNDSVEKQTGGMIIHRFFLLSDDDLAYYGHKGWTSTVACEDSKYAQGYFFNTEEKDSLYYSDCFVCRYDRNGYFVYTSSGKYYKSAFSGERIEISESEYNGENIRISYPFIYSTSYFEFTGNEDGFFVIENKSEEVSGTFIKSNVNKTSSLTIYDINSIALDADSVKMFTLSKSGENTLSKLMFWGENLVPCCTAISY